MRYQVRALDASQQLVDLVFDALDESSLRAQLQQRDLLPVKIKPLKSVVHRSRFPLLLFSQELHALLLAGLSVMESLDVLLKKTDSETHREVLQRLISGLRDGLRLSEVMSREQRWFPPLFVGILKAAEGSSDLPLALARYISYETRMTAVRQKIVSAAIYPVILMAVGGTVTVFLLGYVVPKFSVVYQSGNRHVPWASQLLLDWGAFASMHVVPLALLFTIVVVGLGWWIRRQFRDGAWWRVLSLLPGTRRNLKLLELSRMYLSLGTLLEGGLPIAGALSLASSVLPLNKRPSIDLVANSVAQGLPLSQSLAAVQLTTPVSEGLIRVGERSGQLGAMLVRSAEFYEGETSRWIERFTKAFEPILMAAIGIVIGLIVMLLYMPIFELAGSLQ